MDFYDFPLLMKNYNFMEEQEFSDAFSTEEQCYDYIAKFRSSGGKFVCPKCRETHTWKISNSVYECKDCKKQYSILSGTIFEHTHLPLTKWFRIIDERASTVSGIREILTDNGIKNARTVKKAAAAVQRVFDNVRKYDSFYCQAGYSDLLDLCDYAIRFGTVKYLFYRAIQFAVEDEKIDSNKVTASEQALEKLEKECQFLRGPLPEPIKNKPAFIKRARKSLLGDLKLLESKVDDAYSSWLLDYYMEPLLEKIENLRRRVEKL